MVAREKDGPARVLVIDDDEAICGLISKYLQHLGHSVEYQPDGRELDTALSAPLDVVLLDVNLQDTDGFALLERVVRERPDISVIMLTASTEVENVVEAMRRGAFDYLSKPIDFQRLNLSLIHI